MGIFSKIKLGLKVNKLWKVAKPLFVNLVAWAGNLKTVWENLNDKQKIQILKAIKSLGKNVCPDQYKEKFVELLEKAIEHYEKE